MFQLATPDQAYDYPVTVEKPTPGGEIVTEDFTARFKLIPDSVVQESDDMAILEAALVGWDGINDHNAHGLPFNKKNRTMLCDIPYWRRCTVQAYVRFAAGLPVKNSAPPPADGGKETAAKTN